MNLKQPKWIHIPPTLVAPFVLLLFILFPNLYLVLTSVVVWFGLFLFLFFKYSLDTHQTGLNFMTALSFIILILLVETILFRWFLVVLSAFVFFFIAYWSNPHIEHAVYIKEKPLRRMMMMLYVFNVYALLLGLFAIHIYFQNFPFVWLSILGGIYAAFGSYFIWSLYFKLGIQKFFVWIIVISLCVIELMWVISLLPFGYLASGLFVVWLWYIIQLFVRFHLSSKGILWHKQWLFLLSNFILYSIIMLYIVQWI